MMTKEEFLKKSDKILKKFPTKSAGFVQAVDTGGKIYFIERFWIAECRNNQTDTIIASSHDNMAKNPVELEIQNITKIQ